MKEKNIFNSTLLSNFCPYVVMFNMIRKYQKEHQVNTIEQELYSPDIASCDFFSFLQLKLPLQSISACVLFQTDHILKVME